VYAWRAERYGSPFAGGWMDWPAGFIEKMNYCSTIYNAIKYYQSTNKPPPSPDGEKTIGLYLKWLKRGWDK